MLSTIHVVTIPMSKTSRLFILFVDEIDDVNTYAIKTLLLKEIHCIHIYVNITETVYIYIYIYIYIVYLEGVFYRNDDIYQKEYINIYVYINK